MQVYRRIEVAIHSEDACIESSQKLHNVLKSAVQVSQARTTALHHLKIGSCRENFGAMETCYFS